MNYIDELIQEANSMTEEELKRFYNVHYGFTYKELDGYDEDELRDMYIEGQAI